MPRFRVQSGDYDVIVQEKTLRKAADVAIQRHGFNSNSEKLGELLMVEKLDRNDKAVGPPEFLNTQLLIEENTPGFGEEDGQYKRID